jgi:hypothetical protein
VGEPPAGGDATLAQVLAEVGRLEARQVAGWLGVSSRAAEARLERAVATGAAVKFRGAYWHPGCPRRQANHRALVADAYLAARRWPEQVTTRPVPLEGSRPDLLLELPEGRILALEADTGSESARQWREKAAGYRASAHAADLVLAVAPTPARAARLAGWWRAEADVPPMLAVALADFPRSAPTLPPRGAAPPAAGEGMGTRRTFCVLAGRLLTPAEAAAAMAQPHLRVLGTERRAGFDLLYLGPSSGRI